MCRSSAIFNAKKSALLVLPTKAVSAAPQLNEGETSGEEDEKSFGREKVDLTIEQTLAQEDDNLEDMDDFDLLEATIDPSDVKSLMRRRELQIEL